MGVYTIFGNQLSFVGRFDYVRQIHVRQIYEQPRPFRNGIWTRLLKWSITRRPDGQPLRHKLNYQLLDFTNFETRFLKILPYDFDALTPMICCEIVHASVVNSPAYVALSYCWGDQTVTTSVIVDCTAVEVTVNLAEALAALRAAGEVLVWADALCINQDDLYERSYQIQRMGGIYSKATKVVSWLGHGHESNNSIRKNHRLLSRSASSGRPLVSRVSAGLFKRLCGHPYWRRVWIIQEVSKAIHVEVWYGSHWGWDLDELLRSMLEIHDRIPMSEFEWYALKAVQYFRKREQQSHIAVARMLLSESLLRSRMSLATDPRDKIYALLSMTLDGNEVVPTPNYVQSFLEVNKEVAKSMIINQGQTSLMLLAKGNNASPYSWIPSWSTITCEVSPWVYKSVLEERETLDISTHALGDNAIRIKGSHFDSVGRSDLQGPATSYVRCHISQSGRIRSPSVHQDSLETMLDLWDALTIGATTSRDAKLYSPHRQDLRTSRRQAVALAGLLLGINDRFLPTLETWFEYYKGVYIYKHSLEHWVESHFQNALRLRWDEMHFASTRERTSKLKSLGSRLRVDREAAALETGLKLMAKYRMKVIVTRMNRFAVVSGDSRTGDHICRLENCSLPVVLRPEGRLPSKQALSYGFIGEVAWPTFEKCDCEERGCAEALFHDVQWSMRHPSKAFFTIF